MAFQATRFIVLLAETWIAHVVLIDILTRKIKFLKWRFIYSTGLDGKACVLRALCEAAQRDPSDLGKGSLIQEVLHAIFTWVSDLSITSVSLIIFDHKWCLWILYKWYFFVLLNISFFEKGLYEIVISNIFIFSQI